ncbi:MAG TPA: PAAR domain-containing protein [Actinomycetes bacterium]
MGTPAAVMGDRISGTCTVHLVPGPTGSPVPAPPLPFSAPLTVALATRTLIRGKPAALQGSSGLNTPPHVGLHPSDPFVLPASQIGRVVKGSTSVLIEGRPAAKTGSTCTINANAPGQLSGTAATVLIGG